MVFLLSILLIVTTPKILGTPTNEGVHQDGGDFTMTVLLKSDNVDFKGRAGLVNLVNLKESIGTSYDRINPKNIIGYTQPRNYLDTLIFVDTAMSHVVNPVLALEKNEPAHRDIFTTTTRHMAKRDDPNSSYALLDKEIPHKTFPCAFALQSKNFCKKGNVVEASGVGSYRCGISKSTGHSIFIFHPIVS